MHARIPEIIEFKPVMDPEEGNKTKSLVGKPMMAQDLYFLFSNGVKKTAGEIINSFIKDKLTGSKIDEIVKETINFPPATLIKFRGSDLTAIAKGVEIQGILRERIEKLEINGEDYVWMIMKAIFEKKQFVISKEGKIHNSDI